MNKSKNIIYATILLIGATYIVYMIFDYRRLKSEILLNGAFTTGVIYEEFIGTDAFVRFDYKYLVNNHIYKNKLAVSPDYFNKHQIGDTLIIKFLPSWPEKSIIIEREEYKQCMGLPPKEGWRKLPRCE